MNSSTRNTQPAESPKRSIAESEEIKNRANREFADRFANQAVEGLRKLAEQKRQQKAQKDPDQAA